MVTKIDPKRNILLLPAGKKARKSGKQYPYIKIPELFLASRKNSTERPAPEEMQQRCTVIAKTADFVIIIRNKDPQYEAKMKFFQMLANTDYLDWEFEE